MDQSNPTQKLKYNPQFVEFATHYITTCHDAGTIPSVEEFATLLGTDVYSVYGWANKKTKDEQGNPTTQLARPEFFAVIKQIKTLSQTTTRDTQNEVVSTVDSESPETPVDEESVADPSADLIAIPQEFDDNTPETPEPEEIPDDITIDEEIPEEEKTQLAEQPKKPEPKKTTKKKEKVEPSLNPKQELFCQLYATNRDMFGNGVEAYAEAYDLDMSKGPDYNTARTNASRLLTNANILKRIDELLELGPLNNTTVDKQLAFVITQNADLSSKVAAIREYNKLKARITEKIDHTTKGKALPTPILGGQARVPADDSDE